MTPEQYPQTDHLREDLAGRTTRGGTVMLASQVVKFGLTIVSAAILARLLTPEDYGLIAMVTVVINFSYSFRSLGLSAATMQKPQLMVAQVSNLFWINTGLSIVVMLLTAASARLLWQCSMRTRD